MMRNGDDPQASTMRFRITRLTGPGNLRRQRTVSVHHNRQSRLALDRCLVQMLIWHGVCSRLLPHLKEVFARRSPSSCVCEAYIPSGFQPQFAGVLRVPFAYVGPPVLDARVLAS